MREFDKMMSGQYYRNADPELLAMRAQAKALLLRVNASGGDEALRATLLRELLGTMGENLVVEPPFYCDYGFNIHVGANFYANSGCIILDVVPVHIGDNVLLGPQVGLYPATHPIDPAERRAGWEYGRPITIGNDCWIGGHAVLLPGVTLGDNVVVGAGAVVTKSFPGGVVLGGNPARVLRRVDDRRL